MKGFLNYQMQIDIHKTMDGLKEVEEFQFKTIDEKKPNFKNKTTKCNKSD